MSTAVVNAYLGPVMRSYIERLAGRLPALGMTATPHLTQSNGGVIGFEQAARLPVRTVLSGPSTGVVGAQAVGRLAGYRRPDHLRHGRHQHRRRAAAGRRSAAWPARRWCTAIRSRRRCSTSIPSAPAAARSPIVDCGGLLKVGPRSAGADPGPVCYDRGNTEPTVTDANVVLQTLNPTHLLGGRMTVHQDLASAAIGPAGGDARAWTTMATAQGIISVVTANMARAIRVISVQRGHDPRDYTLVAFGGAGPLHAARLAKELDIGRILVPRNPGILCAMGLLLTDLRADFADHTAAHAVHRGTAGHRRCVSRCWPAQADAWFAEEAIAAGGASDQPARWTCATPARTTSWRSRCRTAPIGPASLEALAEGFAAAHQRMYGFVAEDDPVQLVTFRVEAAGIGTRRRRSSRSRMRERMPMAPSSRGARFGCRRLGVSLPARFMIASDCVPATASPALRSSSRWMPPPSCCPAWWGGSSRT